MKVIRPRQAHTFEPYKPTRNVEVTVKILNAFSVANTGGNPAGVVLSADGLTPEQKQHIAAKVGLSETAFVSASQTAAFKLDFFTPSRQIPHCGHATIAVFTYLKHQGLLMGTVSSKETIDGNRAIFFESDRAYMEQQAPTYDWPVASYPAIYKSLGLTQQELLPGLAPAIVNTGNSFLIIPVRDQSILQQIQPDFAEISTVSEQHQLIGYYAFSPLAAGSSRQATARMFAPRFGIREEAATGMAAGPLACFLNHSKLFIGSPIRIEQGRFMQPPSISSLDVRLEMGSKEITTLFVGGDAYLAGERVIRL